MSPIWGRYGPFLLYGYTVFLIAGALLALALTAFLARRQPTGERHSPTGAPAWLDAALVAAGGAIAGGRAVFVWLNAGYFSENPAEAWQFWRGGLNYHGALLAGLAALALWAVLARRPFLTYAALLTPGLALLVAFGWAGCLVDGCAYGRVTLPGPLAGDLPDDTGVMAIRYRTQAAGALGALAVFALVWRSAQQTVRPRLFWAALAGLAGVHVIVALGRGDPSPLLLGLRLDLLLELAILFLALVALLITGLHPHKTDQTSSHGPGADR